MASFDRNQYFKVFNFARRAFYHFESRDIELELEAAEIMELCEGVLGQQKLFPKEAREVLGEQSNDDTI